MLHLPVQLAFWGRCSCPIPFGSQGTMSHRVWPPGASGSCLVSVTASPKPSGLAPGGTARPSSTSQTRYQS